MDTLTAMNQADGAISDEFGSVQVGGAFIAHNGPLFARLLEGRVHLRFRIEPRYTNPLGICHGAMLATLADMLMPCAAMYRPQSERCFLPTIGL